VKSDLFTDWWPRERKAVFNLLHSREQIEGHEMTRAKKRKRQQSCDIAKLIDRIQKATAIALRIYQAIGPVAKAILTNGRKTK
jgi:hypothetical protein